LKEYQVVIIGSGPGGYVAAIRAGILGLKTALVEKDPFLGGTCLHRGCIPTKALLHTAHLYDEIKHASDHGLSVSGLAVDYPKVHKRKAAIVTKLAQGTLFLMKKRKVDVLTGVGRITDATTVEVTGEKGTERIRAAAIIVATGSTPARLPHIEPDHKIVLDSDSVLVEEKIPGALAVIGAGAVGVEFASIFNSFGSKVTIIELLPRVVPIEDEDISKALEQAFKKKGIDVFTSSEVKAVEKVRGGADLKIKVSGGEKDLHVDRVLLSVGRKPLTQNLGLEDIGVTVDKRGYIAVNDFMQTNVPNVYAIGDVVPTPLLAHVASAEGILAVDHIAGKEARPLNYNRIPNCTYCSPEVASMGLTEKAAREQGYKVKVGQFPFAGIGKAMILGDTGGFVKIVGEETYDEVLGVHIIGARATEMIAEACLGASLETTTTEIAKTVHPHPTLSEAMAEAAHSVYGEAIHI
jgi:dihydrolipoamide dehydrogenase